MRRIAAVTTLLAFGCILVGAQGTSAAPAPCNGSSLLCSRGLDRVVLPGTHNSMAATDEGYDLPNQKLSIPGQLAKGARAFLIDTHYGRVEFFEDGRSFVQNIPREEGERLGADVYLCHVLCPGGASDLVEVFGQVRDFLEANPREVILFVNEAYVAPDDFTDAVADSGLLPYVYEEPLGDPWPTLDQMIESGGRVVFLAQDEVGTVPWYHLAYDGLMRETPYSFNALVEEDTDKLTDPALLPASCAENRGGNDGGLFLMNHWILGYGVTPMPEFARVVNTRSALVARARACETLRGKTPTILAVDFFEIGDTVGAARVLNGLIPPSRAPRLTPAQIRKKARALCRKKKGRARRACIRRQTARLKKQNGRPRARAVLPG